MKDSERDYLRSEVRRLDRMKYPKKQIIDVLVIKGFKRNTIKRYCEALCVNLEERK